MTTAAGLRQDADVICEALMYAARDKEHHQRLQTADAALARLIRCAARADEAERREKELLTACRRVLRFLSFLLGSTDHNRDPELTAFRSVVREVAVARRAALRSRTNQETG